MNLKQLSYIIALNEEESINAAAKKLEVSQSSISKHLLKLEQELGVQLFLRSQRKLTPTAYGRIYMEAAKQIMQIYSDTAQSISGISSRKGRVLSLGVHSYYDLNKVSIFLPGFQEQYPDISVRVQETSAGNLAELAGDGKLDFAVMDLIAQEDDRLCYIPLCRESIVLAVPSVSPLAILAQGKQQPAPLHLDMIRNTPLIMNRESTALWAVVSSILSRGGIVPNVVCELPDSSTVLSLVKQGMGCAFLPDIYMDQDGRAVYFRLPEDSCIYKFLVFHKDMPRQAGDEDFMERLKSLYGCAGLSGHFPEHV